MYERVEDLEDVDPKDRTISDKDALKKIQKIHIGELQLVMKALMKGSLSKEGNYDRCCTHAQVEQNQEKSHSTLIHIESCRAYSVISQADSTLDTTRNPKPKTQKK